MASRTANAHSRSRRQRCLTAGGSSRMLDHRRARVYCTVMKFRAALLAALFSAAAATAVTPDDYASRADVEKDIAAHRSKLQTAYTDEQWPEVALAAESLAERVRVLDAFSRELPIERQDKIGWLVIESGEAAAKLADAAIAADREAASKWLAEMDRVYRDIQEQYDFNTGTGK